MIVPHSPFPGDASGRPVTMTGSYDAAGQVLVADRRLDGVAGYWVLTPFVVDATGVSGSARIAVLRGFVTDGSGAGPAPSPAGQGHRDPHLAPGSRRRRPALGCRPDSSGGSTWPAGQPVAG